MMKARQSLSIILVLVMVLSVMPVLRVHAAEVTGETGNCTWSYDAGTKVMTVSPKSDTDGVTASYTNPDANESFPSLKDEVQAVVIEEGVTSLGNHLFAHFSTLENITFPQNSLVALGEGVFRNCDALASVTIPDTVTSIDRTLFYGCDALETVTMGGSYATIPGIAFGACPKLTMVTIPASVTSLEVSVSGGGVTRGVFYNSSAVASITYGGTKDQWETLLNGLPAGSSDVTLLNSGDVTVTCSDGVYGYKANDETFGTLGQPLEICAATGTTTKFFPATIEAGKVYKLTAQWNTAPTMTGVKSEWEIESWTGMTTSDSRCETLFQATKRESDASGTSTQGFEITFKAAKNASALALNVQNLSVDNSITVTLAEATLEEGKIADVTVHYAANTDMGSNLFDIALTDGQKYIVEASWTDVPYHWGPDSGGTAWKVQPVTNEDFWGNNTAYYYSVMVSGSEPVAVQQNYTGTFESNASYTMFNVYAQRVSTSNSIRVVIKEDNTPIIPFTAPVDYATTEKLFDVPFTTDSGNASNYLQGLEIYNDIVFLVYDGGYVRTYDFKTGAFIQEFRLESALESNHAGGATFSKYKYAENDPFPLMYVSCDLSTLGCYVERITYDENGNFQSEMVQYLDFSTLKGWKDGTATSAGIHTHNGSLAMIEKETNTIVYLGRQLRSIGDAENKFVMAHFALPACSQGNTDGTVYNGGYTIVGESDTDIITVDCPVVHFTNDDILDVANAEQDTDGYYYWDYYGRYYQGSCVYKGQVMMSHGLNTNYPNNWGEETFYTGIMNYAYDSDKMSRFLDITGSIGWTEEPQGLLVYQGRLLHIMTHEGYGVYEVKIKLDDLEESYDLGSCTTVDAVKAAIEDAVEEDIKSDFSVEEVILPENFALTSGEQTFTAQVNIYTTWNVQPHEISFTVTGNGEASNIDLTIIDNTAGSASITPPADGWAEGINTFTVSCDDACVVAVSNDNGATYTRLAATATETEGTYSFTAENIGADTKITIVKLGDTDGNGEIAANDAAVAKGMNLGSITDATVQQLLAVDLNGDGAITANEVAVVKAATLGNVLSW